MKIIFPHFDSVTEKFCKIADNLNPEKYWYALAKISIRSHPYLLRAERIIGAMPEEEKIKLAEKFQNIVKKASSWKKTFDRQFLDILVEIYGFGYLLELGKIPRFSVTPDIIADNGNIGMECKNIWMSDIEQEYLNSTIKSSQYIEARDVEEVLIFPNISNPFYNKVKDTLDIAEAQIKNCKHKIIYVNISLDSSALLQREDIIKNILNRETEDRKIRGIEVIWTDHYKEKKFI